MGPSTIWVEVLAVCADSEPVFVYKVRSSNNKKKIKSV